MAKKKKNSGGEVFHDDYERELDASLSRGEWVSVEPKKKADMMKEAQEAARNFFNKDARVNIRISSHDLNQVKYKAMQEGLPYQTLLSSVIHKYVTGVFS